MLVWVQELEKVEDRGEWGLARPNRPLENQINNVSNDVCKFQINSD